jgi:DNA-binding NarL/FixJ family response regulator
MSTPVAAVNTASLVTLGLSQALEPSGYEIEEVNDPLTWAERHPSAAMVIHIRRREDVDLVIDLTTQHSMVIVAMLDSTSNEELRLCLSAGARACVSPDWGKDELVLAIKASLLGMAVIPSPLAQSMACSNPTPASTQDLSAGQVGWLRDLAAGSTVQALARRTGFSEREMYRRLREVYRTMGCSSRTEALLRASGSGLLSES